MAICIKWCSSWLFASSWRPSKSFKRTSWGTLHPHPLRSANLVSRKWASRSWALGSKGRRMAKALVLVGCPPASSSWAACWCAISAWWVWTWTCWWPIWAATKYCWLYDMITISWKFCDFRNPSRRLPQNSRKIQQWRDPWRYRALLIWLVGSQNSSLPIGPCTAQGAVIGTLTNWKFNTGEFRSRGPKIDFQSEGKSIDRVPSLFAINNVNSCRYCISNRFLLYGTARTPNEPRNLKLEEWKQMIEFLSDWIFT